MTMAGMADDHALVAKGEYLACAGDCIACHRNLVRGGASSGQPFPGDRGRGLSPDDNRCSSRSIARLKAPELSHGRSDRWSNLETQNSGTSTVLRVFDGGFVCHLIRHSIVFAGRHLAQGLSPHLVPHRPSLQ
jgi:hypothetical protein